MAGHRTTTNRAPTMTYDLISPQDEFNRELVDQAHPADWQNPTPAGRYNLVAIGGGSAGIISALGTAGLGGTSALVERHLLGGDCLNCGCVPSKAVIRAARAAYQASNAGSFGVESPGETTVDFAAAMQRMRKLRARISHHDSAERFTELGTDVFLGDARFTGPDALEVAGQTLRFSRCVIATGARAAVPPIPGLDAIDYLTNETVFSLTERPRRLLVLGGGPIGSELAQAFRRLGSEVHLIDLADRVLSREEPDAGEVVRQQFEREGIHLHLGFKAIRAELIETGKRLIITGADGEQALEGDEILVAVGRAPNVEGLDLETAGVAYDRRGVQVDDRLRTTNRRIFAAGDVIGSYQFTHAADAMARMCVQNALFFGRQRLSRLVVPRTTYTAPEVAHVGLTSVEAADQGIEIDTHREQLSNVDRAVLDGDENGFAVVHCRQGTGHIVGATIVAPHAGEMIGEITLLMTNRLPLSRLAGTIHCYPTQVEVLKRIADQYSRSRLTPRLASLFKWWLARRR